MLKLAASVVLGACILAAAPAATAPIGTACINDRVGRIESLNIGAAVPSRACRSSDSVLRIHGAVLAKGESLRIFKRKVPGSTWDFSIIVSFGLHSWLDADGGYARGGGEEPDTDRCEVFIDYDEKIALLASLDADRKRRGGNRAVRWFSADWPGLEGSFRAATPGGVIEDSNGAWTLHIDQLFVQNRGDECEATLSFTFEQHR